MNPSHRPLQALRATAATALLVLLAACGGGLDPILGTPAATGRPTVTATVPATATPAVVNVDTRSVVSATFSKPMSATTLTAASFTLACPTGAPVAGLVAYNAATQTATLTPAAPLPPSTTCIATVSTAAQDNLGVALASAYTWSFVTGIATPLDTTRPTVTLTVPAAGAAAVATNTRISVTFSEAMNAASVTATSFTLASAGGSVLGTVAYDAASLTAVFTPTTPATLAAGTSYTVTLSTALTDVAGNALAGNTAVLPGAGAHVYTFSTGLVGDTTPPTVLLVSPADGAVGVCPTQSVSAVFSEPMNASTVGSASFSVTDAGVAVPGTVSYNASTQTATFVPSAAGGFSVGRSFVATVLGGASGARDLAGNPMAANRVWSFSTAAQACPPPVVLGTAATFGAFGGGAGVTNQGVNSVVGGNLGTTAACTLVTGFHDAANIYTETPLNKAAVNGSIQCGPPAPGTVASLAVATQARADAQAAYNALAALPPGSDPGAGQLGGLVLTPGVYTAAGGTFAITGGNLTLDARGDPNAVWVFQTAAGLTVGLPATPRRVLLVNGAQARNVYWKVGSAARIEDGSTMVGTLIAPAGVTISTAGQTLQTTLIGRAIGLTASVTLVNTTIVAP